MTHNTAIIAILLLCASLITSCHQETIQDKAEREAKEYTRRYCPTPPINDWSTDSITFDRATNLYTYHCTFSGILDDIEVIKDNKDKIREILRKSIVESTSMKPYVDAGFRFQYICRSEKDKSIILFEVKF